MRLLRPIVAAGLLLAGGFALPAQAHVSAVPSATSTTVVTAAQTGYLDLQLSDDVRLSPSYGANPDVALSGQGRFVGAWLVRGQDLNTFSDDFVQALRLPDFLGGERRTQGSAYPAPSCTSAMPLGLNPSCAYPDPQGILLHEGNYRLYVLTDGSPITVTLHLHGLVAGTTELRTAHALPSAERVLPQLDGVGTSLITFGAVAPLSGSVATWTMATAKGSDTPTWREASTCERQDTDAAPRLAYGPHCPNGRGGGYQYTVSAGGQNVGGVGGFVSSGGDDTPPVGLGGSFGDTGGVTLLRTLGVWMQLP